MSLSYIEPSKVETLLILENDLEKAGARHGLQMKRTKPHHLEALMKLTPNKYLVIENHMVSLLDVFAICTKEGVDPWDDREFFRLCMRALHLSYPTDCLDHIQSGELLEGYNLDRLQIFRNLRFMEYSNYSLLEILSIEWPLLFERAQIITDKMITFCDETLWSKNRTIPFNVPVHYMRELQTVERQLYEIRFKTISPLFSGPNSPFGLLGICHCRLLDSEKSQNLAFI